MKRDPNSHERKRSLGHLLGLASRLLRDRLSANLAEAGYQLTATESIVMAHLHHHEGLTQREIGDLIERDRTATTRLVDSLESQRLVRRVHDRKDRRCNKVFLTKTGLRTVREAQHLMKMTLIEALNGAGETQITACERVLEQVIENLTESK